MLKGITPRRRFRLSIRLGLLVLGGLFAFMTALALERESWKAAICWGILALVVSSLEFVVMDVITDRIYPARTTDLLGRLDRNPNAIEAKIQAAVSHAIAGLQGCDRKKVSGTFHLIADLFSPTDDSTEPVYVQVTSYSGHLGGRKWRFISHTKGLVGRCIRTGKAEWVNFRTPAEYRELMVRDFGFSVVEMARHTEAARSYWAEPVKSGGSVIGAIFLFSTEVQAFPGAVDRFALEATAKEIAQFLEGAAVIPLSL